MIEHLKYNMLRLWRRLRFYRIDFVLWAVSGWRTLHRGSSSKMRESSNDRKRILVVRLDAIGDLVMSTLVFSELKNRFPASHITAVIQRGNREILETNPSVDRILSPEPIGSGRLFVRLRQDLAIISLYRKHLRGEYFDIALSPKLGPDWFGANLLLKLVDAKQSFRYEDVSVRRPIASITARALRTMITLPNPKPRHEVISNRTIVEQVTKHPCASSPEIHLTPEDIEFSSTIVSKVQPQSTIISVSIGAGARRRKWPAERWISLLSMLSEERQTHLMFITAPSDEAVVTQIREMLLTDATIVCGTTLRKAAAIIKASDLFIGPDSGLAHIAAAVGCPEVIISPHPQDGDPEHENSPLRFGPYSTDAKVIQPAHGLSPCTTQCEAIEPHCILQITPAQTTMACEEILNRTCDRPVGVRL